MKKREKNVTQYKLMCNIIVLYDTIMLRAMYVEFIYHMPMKQKSRQYSDLVEVERKWKWE